MPFGYVRCVSVLHRLLLEHCKIGKQATRHFHLIKGAHSKSVSRLKSAHKITEKRSKYNDRDTWFLSISEWTLNIFACFQFIFILSLQRVSTNAHFWLETHQEQSTTYKNECKEFYNCIPQTLNILLLLMCLICVVSTWIMTEESSLCDNSRTMNSNKLDIFHKIA